MLHNKKTAMIQIHKKWVHCHCARSLSLLSLADWDWGGDWWSPVQHRSPDGRALLYYKLSCQLPELDRNAKIYSRIPCWKINSVACWPQNTWLYSKHVVVRTDSNSFKVLQFSYHSFITPPGNWRVSVSVTFLNCSVLCSSKSEIQARQQTAQSHQIKHQMEEKTLTQR